MTRLIDADALYQKTFFHTYPVKILDNEKKVLDEVLRLIDNAPTVTDVIPNEEGYEMYSKGYTLGKEKGKNERPRGEWIDTGEMEEYWADEYQCSICGVKNHWHNFCPYCGADMRESEGSENV